MCLDLRDFSEKSIAIDGHKILPQIISHLPVCWLNSLFFGGEPQTVINQAANCHNLWQLLVCVCAAVIMTILLNCFCCGCRWNLLFFSSVVFVSTYDCLHLAIVACAHRKSLAFGLTMLI